VREWRALGLRVDFDHLLGVNERGEGEDKAQERELQWTKSGHENLIELVVVKTWLRCGFLVVKRGNFMALTWCGVRTGAGFVVFVREKY